MEETYEYRLILSSWGIFIDITAEAISAEDYEEPKDLVAPGLFLSIRDENLNTIDKGHLRLGLNLVAQQIAEKTKDQVVICVNDVLFYPCDDQADGLICAVMGWAAQYYGFKTPKVPVTFNKTKNRYDFSFSETVEKEPEIEDIEVIEEIEEYIEENEVDEEPAKDE